MGVSQRPAVNLEKLRLRRSKGVLKTLHEAEESGELGKEGRSRKDAARFVQEINLIVAQTKSR